MAPKNDELHGIEWRQHTTVVIISHFAHRPSPAGIHVQLEADTCFVKQHMQQVPLMQKCEILPLTNKRWRTQGMRDTHAVDSADCRLL